MRFTLSVFATLAVAAGIVAAADASPSAAKDALDKAGIPTELGIKDFKPQAVLDVSFPGTPQPGSQLPPPAIQLDHGGAQLSKNNISNPPTFCLRVPGKPFSIGSNDSFVIAMMDLDATSPEKSEKGSFRQFLGGGFKPNADGVCLFNNTPATTEYQPPSPSEGSDPHKIALLVYKEPTGFKEQTEVAPDSDRNGFNITKLAEKLGMGEPIAGTYASVKP